MSSNSEPDKLYADESVIAQGGFGEVCVCDNNGTKYAKKKAIDRSNPGVKARFSAEVNILKMMDHPNVVKVVHYNLTDDPFWYVMPLYRNSLAKELPNIAGDVTRIAQVFSQVLDGIDYSHHMGVVHRDLKPGNVLLNSDSDLALADFGLARTLDSDVTRYTKTGDCFGTERFSAPEQFDDAKKADLRADIYALGRILYVLHVGKIAVGDLDLKLLPVNIRTVVAKCTAREPLDRFQSVAELKSAWEGPHEHRALSKAKIEIIKAKAVHDNKIYLVAYGVKHHIQSIHFLNQVYGGKFDEEKAGRVAAYAEGLPITSLNGPAPWLSLSNPRSKYSSDDE